MCMTNGISEGQIINLVNTFYSKLRNLCRYSDTQTGKNGKFSLIRSLICL